METENQINTVASDLQKIKDLFAQENRRFVKSDMLAKFINDETLSPKSRALASEAVEGLYEDVVWEDDVFGYHLSISLGVVKLRYELANS